ncbi:hypothetical protein [Azospirillum doebereinerae]
MINATVFGSTSSSVQWKAVTTLSSDSVSSLFKPSSGSTDSVAVSKLGQALSGVAADAFKHLDPKARGTLEGLVNSGQISADDAVLGLRSLATKATFGRYTRERPQDDQDKQMQSAKESAWNNLQTSGDRVGAARAEFGKTFADLQASQERGAISMEDVQAKLVPAQKKLDETLTSIRASSGEADGGNSVLFNADGFTKNAKGFDAAMASQASGDGFTALYSEKGNAAEQKLASLGFNTRAFGNAFKDFAATVDIPGIGRAAGAAAPATESEAPAAKSSAPAATPTETVLTAAVSTTPAPDSASATASATAAKPATDPGNAQQAAAMLAAALGGGGTKATGILGTLSDKDDDASDTVLDSLVQSLKAGTAQSKSNTTQSA